MLGLLADERKHGSFTPNDDHEASAFLKGYRLALRSAATHVGDKSPLIAGMVQGGFTREQAVRALEVAGVRVVMMDEDASGSTFAVDQDHTLNPSSAFTRPNPMDDGESQDGQLKSMAAKTRKVDGLSNKRERAALRSPPPQHNLTSTPASAKQESPQPFTPSRPRSPSQRTSEMSRSSSPQPSLSPLSRKPQRSRSFSSPGTRSSGSTASSASDRKQALGLGGRNWSGCLRRECESHAAAFKAADANGDGRLDSPKRRERGCHVPVHETGRAPKGQFEGPHAPHPELPRGAATMGTISLMVDLPPSSPPCLTGKLDFGEFKHLVRDREKGGQLISEAELRRRFAAIDVNGSGAIDPTVYVMHALRDALSCTGNRVTDLLRAWDSEGNGLVERREFRRAVRAMGFDVVASSDEIDALFDSFDADGSGVLEYRELHQLLRLGRGVSISPSLRDGAHGAHGIGSRPMQSHRLRTATGHAGAGVAPATAEDHLAARPQPVLRKVLQVDSRCSVQEQLRQCLREHSLSVLELFRAWDADGDGHVSRAEFRRAVAELGYEAPRSVVDAVFAGFDRDGSGSIEYEELEAELSWQPRRPLTVSAADDRRASITAANLAFGRTSALSSDFMSAAADAHVPWARRALRAGMGSGLLDARGVELGRGASVVGASSRACSPVLLRGTSPGHQSRGACGGSGGGSTPVAAGHRDISPAPLPYVGHHASGNRGVIKPWVRQAHLKSPQFASDSPRFQKPSAATPGPGAYGHY